MREIKFRGLGLGGHDWHFGNVSILKQKVNNVKAGHYISNSVGLPFAYDVRPETVGQYTGLLDKNGKEIYEKDIIKAGDDICVVNWHKEFAGFCLDKKGWMFSHFFAEHCLTSEVEVIGNIYEDSSLLDKS